MRKYFSKFPAMSFSFLLLMPVLILGQGSPVVIWTQAAHNRSIEAVAYSPLGEKVISGSSYDESSAKIWNGLNSDLIETYLGHVNGIQSVDISADEKYMAVGYIVTDYASFGETRLYDLEQDQIVDTLDGCYVEFSSNGQLLATAGGGVSRYLYIHRLSDGTQLNAFYNGTGYIRSVSFSPDNNMVAAACTDNTIKLWDIGGDSLIHTLEAHADDVNAVAISPDGKLLASGAGGWDEPGESTIKVWEVGNWKLLHTLEGHAAWVSALAFSPDGQRLLSSGRDGTGSEANPKIKAWSIQDGTLINFYDADLAGGVADLEYSPDGQSIIFGRGDGTLVKAIPPEYVVPSTITDQTGKSGSFQLQQNYPNPFNPATLITYQLRADSEADLSVFNILGQKIITLVNEFQKVGTHKVNWNAQSHPAGIYFYRLTAGPHEEIRRMVLVR